jgi:hypothetical protein
MKLRTMNTLLKTMDSRVIRMQPKTADKELGTAEHRAWREVVIQRAGYRCEHLERGVRCTKSMPTHRMFADHIVERKDGGALLDPANGRCLCGSHHTTKTNWARAERARQTFAPSDKG